jgi:hypothetical protein
VFPAPCAHTHPNTATKYWEHCKNLLRRKMGVLFDILKELAVESFEISEMKDWLTAGKFDLQATATGYRSVDVDCFTSSSVVLS